VEIQTHLKRFETVVMEKIDFGSTVTMSCLMKQHAAGSGNLRQLITNVYMLSMCTDSKLPMYTCQVLDMTVTIVYVVVMIIYTQLPIMKATNTSPLGGIIDFYILM
jgi:hypothetical protein